MVAFLISTTTYISHGIIDIMKYAGEEKTISVLNDENFPTVYCFSNESMFQHQVSLWGQRPCLIEGARGRAIMKYEDLVDGAAYMLDGSVLSVPKRIVMIKNYIRNRDRAFEFVVRMSLLILQTTFLLYFALSHNCHFCCVIHRLCIAWLHT